MSIIGYRITSFAIMGVLCLGLSRKGVAQTADMVDAVRIKTITVTVYRVREPATVPMAKSETKGQAPSKSAIWVPGFWNLQGDKGSSQLQRG
jgi:hypothetical protein